MVLKIFKKEDRRAGERKSAEGKVRINLPKNKKLLVLITACLSLMPSKTIAEQELSREVVQTTLSTLQQMDKSKVRKIILLPAVNKFLNSKTSGELIQALESINEKDLEEVNNITGTSNVKRDGKEKRNKKGPRKSKAEQTRYKQRMTDGSIGKDITEKFKSLIKVDSWKKAGIVAGSLVGLLFVVMLLSAYSLAKTSAHKNRITREK